MNVSTRTGTVHRGVTIGAWTHPACSGTNSNNHLLAPTTDAITCRRCLASAERAAAKPASPAKAPAKIKTPVAFTSTLVAERNGFEVYRERDTDGTRWVIRRAGDSAPRQFLFTRREAIAWLDRYAA